MANHGQMLRGGVATGGGLEGRDMNLRQNRVREFAADQR
jgi:hypothetical protein